jgi:hypothetical protein
MAPRRSSLNSNPMVRMGRGMAKTGRSMGSIGRPTSSFRRGYPSPAHVYYHVDVEVGPQRPFWWRHFREIVITFGIGLLAVIIASGGFR